MFSEKVQNVLSSLGIRVTIECTYSSGLESLAWTVERKGKVFLQEKTSINNQLEKILQTN